MSEHAVVSPLQPGTQVREALRCARALLRGEEAAREAELLLMHALGVSRAWLFAHSDAALDAEATLAFLALLQRRQRGEPVAYLLGRREFYGLELQVSPATLIPRADTERLVELALERLPRRAGVRVLDLGTGSGAIALALAHERPELDVWATDRSAEALAVARANAQRLGLERVRFLHGDWWAPLQGEVFDLVLSNPPYIEADDPHLGAGDLCFEPADALASGADGFDDLRRIIADAPVHLRAGGWLLFEHGHRQGAQARALLAARGFAEVDTWQDLEQRDRVSGGRWLSA